MLETMAEKASITVLRDGRVLIETDPGGERDMDVFVSQKSQTGDRATTVNLSFREPQPKDRVAAPTVFNTNVDRNIVDTCMSLHQHMDYYSKSEHEWYRFTSDRGTSGSEPRRPKDEARQVRKPLQKMRDVRAGFLKDYFLPLVRNLEPNFDVYYERSSGKRTQVIDKSHKVIKLMNEMVMYKEKIRIDNQESDESDEDLPTSNVTQDSNVVRPSQSGARLQGEDDANQGARSERRLPLGPPMSSDDAFMEPPHSL